MTATSDPAAVADLLNRAAERIRTDGLAKGQFGTPGEPCCADGALRLEVDGRNDPRQPFWLDADQAMLHWHAVLAIADVAGFDTRSLNSFWRWSDSAMSTAESVASTMERAASRLMAEKTPSSPAR